MQAPAPQDVAITFLQNVPGDPLSGNLWTDQARPLLTRIILFCQRGDGSTPDHYVININDVQETQPASVRGFRIVAGDGDDNVMFDLPALGKFAALQNTIYGGGGNDRISGTTGRDRVYGEDGND